MATHAQTVARSPVDRWHAARGARFAVVDGWKVAASYGTVKEEVAAAKGLALADVSAQGKIGFLGSGVPAAADALLGKGSLSGPRRVVRLGAIGMALACRLTNDHLLLLAGFAPRPEIEERVASIGQTANVMRYDAISAYAGFCLLGARASDVLAHLTALEVSCEALPAGTCAATNLAEVQALLIRPPEPPRDVVYVYSSWDFAEYVWERLLESGRFAGIAPIGMEAYKMLMEQAA